MNLEKKYNSGIEDNNSGKNEDEKEENYLPGEIPEPKWTEQPEDYYPEDREIVDIQNRNLEEIAEEFRQKYGLIDKNIITFNSGTREWEIDNKSPEKWKEDWIKLNSKENMPYTDI